MELVNEVLDITQIEKRTVTHINSQTVNILLDDFPPMLKQLQGDKNLTLYAISMTFTRKPC